MEKVKDDEIPGTPEEQQQAAPEFVITHEFQMQLSFINRCRVLLNRKVIIKNFMYIDAPAKPLKSNSEIHISHGFISRSRVKMKAKFSKKEKP